MSASEKKWYEFINLVELVGSAAYHQLARALDTIPAIQLETLGKTPRKTIKEITDYIHTAEVGNHAIAAEMVGKYGACEGLLDSFIEILS